MDQQQHTPSSSHPSHSPNTTTGFPLEPLPKRRKLDSPERPDSKPNGRSAPRRKTACQTCRLRKIKCDGVRPTCGLCRVGNSACEYTDAAPAEKLTLESLNESLSSKLGQIQHEIERLRNVTVSTDIVSPNGLVDPRPSNASEHTGAIEPSKDFLQIPAHRTTADAVLGWHVFEGKWPPMTLISVHFTPTSSGHVGTEVDEDTLFEPAGGLLPADEERIPSLVDQFLQNVHTKNPVLDVEQLVKHARSVAARGLRWDGWSCLVLLASALGTIAKPFGAVTTFSSSPHLERVSSSPWTPDSPASQGELQQADSYFLLACRRLGCLKYSILGSQCYFFAGVYLMYTLRPLLSWQYFVQASTFYQLHMKKVHGLASDVSHCGQLPLSSSNTEDVTRRRLEESMYWSCFKSECEFRVELALPQSELSTYAHPALFPSPPSPAAGRADMADETSTHDRSLSQVSAVDIVSPSGRRSNPLPNEDFDLRRHAKHLCNEEESFYYYLTEIALRRIGNRIINTFFRRDAATWLHVQNLLPIALEFDTQVSAWSANLPTAMKHWEMSETIRAPTYGSLSDGTGNAVSRELSWATDNRLLEMRSWLYQPFLYYLVHSGLSTGSLHTGRYSDSHVPTRETFIAELIHENPTLTAEDAALLYHFISSGVDCNLKILDVRSLRHRHHGLWYDLRATVCASLILLGLVKSGHERWIPGGAEVLWGSSSATSPWLSSGDEVQIGGKIGCAMAELEFWSKESLDMRRHREVLKEATRWVRDRWEEGRRSFSSR